MCLPSPGERRLPPSLSSHVKRGMPARRNLPLPPPTIPLPRRFGADAWHACQSHAREFSGGGKPPTGSFEFFFKASCQRSQRLSHYNKADNKGQGSPPHAKGMYREKRSGWRVVEVQVYRRVASLLMPMELHVVVVCVCGQKLFCWEKKDPPC